MTLTMEPEHRDGVPWYKAPMPRRWHRCRAQTSGELDFQLIERCACGAIRHGGYGPWIERNSSRRRRGRRPLRSLLRRRRRRSARYTDDGTLNRGEPAE